MVEPRDQDPKNQCYRTSMQNCKIAKKLYVQKATIENVCIVHEMLSVVKWDFAMDFQTPCHEMIRILSFVKNSKIRDKFSEYLVHIPQLYFINVLKLKSKWCNRTFEGLAYTDALICSVGLYSHFIQQSVFREASSLSTERS